jgi:hypothetical protein
MKLTTEQKVNILGAVQNILDQRYTALQDRAEPLPFGGKRVVEAIVISEVMMRDFIKNLSDKLDKL